MKIALRSDKHGNLGFVEKYKRYTYRDNSISIMCMADAGGYIAEPYVLRGDEFIPVKQIKEEMGIDKYINAKKPFYSLLGTGNVILSAKIAMSFDNKYLPEKSSYHLYILNRESLVQTGSGRWEASTKLLTVGNAQIEKWLHDVAMRFTECGTDREVFLQSRIK